LECPDFSLLIPDFFFPIPPIALAFAMPQPPRGDLTCSARFP
jgi:hypothetical protein